MRCGNLDLICLGRQHGKLSLKIRSPDVFWRATKGSLLGEADGVTKTDSHDAFYEKRQ